VVREEEESLVTIAAATDLTLAGIAVGLVGGVGGTILTELFRLRRATREEPKLSLEVVAGLAAARVGNNPCAYARLSVSNDRRSTGATGVSVRIERVFGGPAEDAENLNFLGGWQLAWANDDRGDPNVPPAPKAVPPGDSRRIDLAHLNASAVGRAIVDVRPQPNNHLNYLGAGRFTFDVVISGVNAPARRYALDLVHDGEAWNGEHSSAGDRLHIENLRTI